ncbi:MAG TPA: hypothetical protein VHG09_01010 [Longimicrobiales bacterium]|nr:hypothetical protein [Longimicrobiales bacterium]
MDCRATPAPTAFPPRVRAHAQRAAFAAGILTLAACGGTTTPEWCVAAEGARLRVAHEPAGWSTPPELQTAWRMDGSVTGHELMTPTSVAISDVTDRIAMTDFGLREVAVISLDGEWLGRWGSSGEGPGELRAPFATGWRRDGQLVVYDPAGSKLVVFDSSGATLDDVPVDPAFTAALDGGARSIRLDGSGLLLAHPGASFSGDGPARMHVIIRGGMSGTALDTVLRSEAPVIIVEGAAPMTAPGWPVPLGAMHGDSILALTGNSPDYRISVYRNDSLSHVICRDVQPMPFTDEEVQPVVEGVPERVRDAMANAERPDRPAPIGRLMIDNERRLWVQRDRPRALVGLDFVIGREGALLDVYDPEGVFLGEVRLPDNVRFLGATEDLLIGLETGDMDELSVVAFEFDIGDWKSDR